MSNKCYVFEDAQALINSVNQYTQQGGDRDQLKILIKDETHGYLLNASGIHHVDTLYSITDANHQLADAVPDEHKPPYFVGITTGQNVPGVINQSFGDNQTNAMEALTAYGLKDDVLPQALQALRAGHYLLFVEEHGENRYFNLNGAMSASFGAYDTDDNFGDIQGFSYTLND